MAADQRRRRLNSSTFVGCSFREQRERPSGKKRKLRLQQDDLNMRCSIYLEWDEKNKSVLAKREQIGILQKDLVPFVGAVPHCCSGLADILIVPCEIFELENLVNVLSYEVWKTCISETERNILTQLLPREVEPEKVVQELLSGDNFQFGNPFLTWSASLCSGKLHPDDVLQQEQCIKANKRTYFFGLQQYHNDMIEDLQMWKDRWNRCMDPEEKVLPMMWRSRRKMNKSLQLSETRNSVAEENSVATPESCSWTTSEKACSNDNKLNFPEDSKGRKGFSNSTVNNLSDGLKVVAKLRKEEKLQKHNIQLSDGAKYMSYIKVSKEQHQRVKRTMKHTSNSIQPRSLNNVLGNLDTLHVQPFEVFEEEERQKLHDYWLQLANKDIPSGYAIWIKKKLKTQQIVKLLGREFEKKLECQEESDQDDVKDNSDKLPPELTSHVEAMVSQNASAQENEEEKKTKGTENREEDDESVSFAAVEDHEENTASISVRHLVNNMTLDSHDNNVIAKADDLPPFVSEYSGNMNHMGIADNQGDPPNSADGVWSGVCVPGSFPHSASRNHQYASSNNVSLAHPQVLEEQPAQLITMETDAKGKDCGRGLHGESDHLTFYSSFSNQEQNVLQEKNDVKQLSHRQHDDLSFFGAYHTQGRNELLESFFKVHDGGLPYHHEQKMMEMDFQHPGNLMIENSQFSAEFRDQVDHSLPLEMRQKRMNDLYVDHSIQDSVCSDEDRYSVLKHLPVNVQDWGVSTAPMLAPSQSRSSGGDLVSQKWFTRENRAQDGWSCLEGAAASSRNTGSQSNADQSLFSVLSECNELRSGVPCPYDPLGSAEQFMQSGIYSGLGVSVPRTSNILQQTAHSLNYLSHHESSAGQKTNSLGWMSLPRRNSGLQ